jgi:hypothetical protein
MLFSEPIMSSNDGSIGDPCPKAETSPDTEFVTYMLWLVGRIVSNFPWIIFHRYDVHNGIGVRINHRETLF